MPDMSRESHDHNLKNLFLDFPTEALEWILPRVLQKFGNIRDIVFVRQEPKKYRLSDSSLALDMPVLYTGRTGNSHTGGLQRLISTGKYCIV